MRDGMRKGMAFAKRTHRTYSTTARPELPYQEIEVDHCTLDIQLIDEGGSSLWTPRPYYLPGPRNCDDHWLWARL